MFSFSQNNNKSVQVYEESFNIFQIKVKVKSKVVPVLN
jgi:hypothetical protein